MNYRVDWTPSARRQLATIWLNTANRNSVARAATVLERLLMIDPSLEGIPIRRGIRQRFVTPLLADFRVDEKNRSVKILRVRLYGASP
jgi:plasmid stabilization system protein ParE